MHELCHDAFFFDTFCSSLKKKSSHFQLFNDSVSKFVILEKVQLIAIFNEIKTIYEITWAHFVWFIDLSMVQWKGLILLWNRKTAFDLFKMDEIQNERISVEFCI